MLIISIIPAALMIIFLTDIYINIQARKRAVVQPNSTSKETNKSQHQKTLQRQMLILMMTSIAIFLVTTLPVAIYKITSPRQSNISAALISITSIWAGFGWFQTLNYAVSIFSLFKISFLFLHLIFR